MRNLSFLPRYQTALFLVPGNATPRIGVVVDETQHMILEYTFFSSL